ncbi:MAG TPA: hypothetical protein VM186_14945 [Planctomycetota bacterium]|nr:hypothetical protein [Planctomycetota bacterium]
MKAFAWCSVMFAAGAVLVAGSAVLVAGSAAGADQPARPVLLYSLYYHAEGEEQYLPAGNYSEILERLKEHFDVRVNADAMSRATLKDVAVLLIVNPSEAARGGKTPPHVTERDAYEIALFVQNGGGLVFMSNQTPAHNCEKRDSNRLLAQFGMEVLHFDVGVKEFTIPKDAPIVGGLKWKYIYGSLLDVRPDHFAHPRVVLENDPAVPVIVGPAGTAPDAPVGPLGEVGPRGPILAIAEAGTGRVVVGTDGGWLANGTLEQADNWEIARRLFRWAAHLDAPAK